jgi:hypothetical protein
MESLRELVEKGRHELAAHRLVLGVMKEYVRERQPDVAASGPDGSKLIAAGDAGAQELSGTVG